MKLNSTFPAKTGTFCFLVNMVNFLHFYGLEICEEKLGGMAGFMGFYFTNVSLISKEIIHGRNGSISDLFDRIQNQLTNPLNTGKMLPDNKLINVLRETIADGHLPLVWVNDFFLEHSVYYELSFYKSLIILLDIKAETVIYFDNGIREIAIQDFLKAVDLEGKSVIHFSSKRYLEWRTDEYSTIYNGLVATVLGLKENIHSEDEYFGLNGIKAFINRLEVCTQNDILFNYYYQLNRPGGLAVTRRSMQTLCRLLAQWSDSEVANQCINKYNELSEAWRLIGNLLFKLSRSYDRELHSRIINRVHEVLALEVDGVLALEKLKCSLNETLLKKIQ